MLYFLNTSYVTLDGVSIDGSTTLTVHNLMNTQYLYNDAISFIGNSDHNVVENTTAISDDIMRVSSGIILYPEGNEIAIPDSNLIQNNFVKKATNGIYVAGSESQWIKAVGNIIRGNVIGSESDSLITWGIQTQGVQNTIIENNIVQYIRQQYSVSVITHGINNYFGEGTIIRNNVVHNIKSSTLCGSTGILLSGDTWAIGTNNLVYNNMIYDIQSTSPQSDSRVAGIQVWQQDNPKIYYNSVYLSGTGANKNGSAALYVGYSSAGVTNLEAKNNIFVNTRDESPYCASAIYDYTTANRISDYNDLFYDDTNNNNCLVRIGSTNYNLLADWQVTGNDMHSYVEMPHFISSTDLHIDGSIPTYLESRGTPIAEVLTDIDGDIRDDDSTDIGADEFDGVMGVEDEELVPTEFALEQNYPNPFNPSTTIRYSIPTQSKVVIKVYDILGNKVATLLNEEKSVGTYELTWSAANLPSGVYFYQLKAGNFIETKKMLLLK